MASLPQRPIKKLLVANRGEIATRILSTARELSLETYSLYTPNDTSHTLHSTHSLVLSSPSSYLDISELISLVQKHDIDTIPPGYGFLSESAEFASRMLEEANCLVIGPGPDILSQTSNKLHARLLAEECCVPILPALQNPTSDVKELKQFAAGVGYPVIIKAVDGGGGRGIRIVRKEGGMEGLARRALMESPSGKAFVERAAIEGYRHVEVQIVGDGRGGVRHLWERECSIQRRFQKIVEFAPSSVVDRRLVEKVIDAALRMARKVNYSSLGTFEFLVRESPPEFYFLEVNPRLQVEHTITESIAMGIDLVKMQLPLAQGASLSSLSSSNLSENPETPRPLHSLQPRVTAEDVSHDWSLSVGKITSFRFPSGNGIRVDTHLLPSEPTIIGTDFDSLLAKITTTAPTWKGVVQKAKRALADTYILGVTTNLDILHGIVSSETFANQQCDTQWLETNLPSLLEAGKEVSAAYVPKKNAQSSSNAVAASSNVLFRKGDAWSISLTPESEGKAAPPSHLQLTRVLRNQFPASMSAEITYTSPSQPPTLYLLNLSATSASFGLLSSTHSHRLGDPGNGNGINEKKNSLTKLHLRAWKREREKRKLEIP